MLFKNRLLVNACKKNDLKKAEKALRKGLNISEHFKKRGKNWNGSYYWLCYTPLSVAIENNNYEMVEWLLQHGADVKGDGFCSADSEEHLDTNNVLTFAISCGNKEIIKLLLSHGADVNERKGTPLFLSVDKPDFLDIAELLIDKGANLNVKNADGDTPLTLAIKRNDQRLAKLLILRGADVNEKGKDNQPPIALLHCIRGNKLEFLTFLLRNGAAVDEPLHRSYTPLGEAIKFYDKKRIGILLDHGADVNKAFLIPEEIKYHEATEILVFDAAMEHNYRDRYIFDHAMHEKGYAAGNLAYFLTSLNSTMPYKYLVIHTGDYARMAEYIFNNPHSDQVFSECFPDRNSHQDWSSICGREVFGNYAPAGYELTSLDNFNRLQRDIKIGYYGLEKILISDNFAPRKKRTESATSPSQKTVKDALTCHFCGRPIPPGGEYYICELFTGIDPHGNYVPPTNSQCSLLGKIKCVDCASDVLGKYCSECNCSLAWHLND